MSQPAADPRAVTEYRIAATSLKAGDLVNTSPGGEDDWQQVLSVHTVEVPGSPAEPTRPAWWIRSVIGTWSSG